MGKNSEVQWTNHTHNFWYGCKKVSQGCKFCYAERDMKYRGFDFSSVTRSKSFNNPLKWKDEALVFVNSWSDFFIEQADPWRDEAWEIIRQTPHLTYQILTKRPENISDRLPADWDNSWPNVWLGVSVESYEYKWRIHKLNDIPAVIRFVSYEPVLGQLNLFDEFRAGMVDWVIAGGESGYTPRPVDPAWIRWVRDQCQFHDVPFFFKQWGGNKKIDGAWGGRLLDGRTWDEMPEIEPMEQIEQLVMF